MRPQRRATRQRLASILFILVTGVSEAANGPFPAPSNHIWPVSGTTTPDSPISSTFGPRQKSSENSRYDWHRGIDIPTPCLTPLKAIADGVVRMSGDYASLYTDRVVQLCHAKPGAPSDVCGKDANLDGKMDDANNDGVVDASNSSQAYYSNYIHMATTAVVPGQVITKGTTVGGSGESGIGYTGVCHPDGGGSGAGFDHLHFEIRDGGILQRHAVHPLLVLPYNDSSVQAAVLSSVDASNPLRPVVRVSATNQAGQLDFNAVEVTTFDTSSGSPVKVHSQKFDIMDWTLRYSATVATLDTDPSFDGVYADLSVFGADAGITASPASFTSGSLTYTMDLAFWGLKGTSRAGDLSVQVVATDARGGSTTLSSAPVAVSVRGGSVTEGNAGTQSLSFTVELSKASGSSVTVAYATAAGTATAGVDYTAASGTLTFAPSETSKTIAVSVAGDTNAESNETFSLRLSNPTFAILGASIGQGVILNDDAVSATSRPQGAWHEFFAVDTLETPFVGDFNGDGKTDIVTFTRQNPSAIGDVYVALSDGVKFGTNTKWHDFFAITTDESVIIGDYNGDGRDDIATWLGKASRQVYVALSTGSGMLTESAWVSSIGADPTDLVFAGDANGDGKDDLIAFARKEGKVYVALSDGAKFGTPSVWHGFFAVSTYERPRVADVNGDGKADIVTFATDSPTAFGDVYVATSDGAKFVGPTGAANDSSKWHDFFAIRPTEEIRVGDLNADGKVDFFTFLPPSFAQAYSVLSQGTSMADNVLWGEAVAPLLGIGDNVYVGDANGDGKADIIIFSQKEGKVFVSLAQ